MRILVVEDEKNLSKVIKKGLLELGFAVDQSFDGEDGLFLAETENYDLVILDLMIPKKTGIEVCRELRQKGKTTPILMLTAKTQTEDKVTGLDAGADDYLTKPFEFIELRSRIQALLRRSKSAFSYIYEMDTLILDPQRRSVSREGKEIFLTPKEFAILEYLFRHQNEVVTRTQIMEHTWDYNFESLSNVVDVFIKTLRKKIDQPYQKKLIHTVHGVGYTLSDNRK